MRTFTRLFSLFAPLLPMFVLANVYVHGYVRYPNGAPAAGITVTITSDSAVAQSPCQQTHYRITNSTGFYVDTLQCSGTISTVKTWIISPCNYNQILHIQAPTANFNVESNFTICDSTNNVCFASFNWQDTLNRVVFNSSMSGGISPVDTIISRVWTFGDGTTLSGNVVNPTHTYPTPGTYSVCLKIVTLFGCERTFCTPISTLSSLTCNSLFSWTRSNAILYRMLFNSSASFAVAGDSIISRKWKFGDGDSLAGNVISPEHTYPTYGTYTACLTIRTRLGCEKTFCNTISLLNPVTNCHAYFVPTFLAVTASGYPVRFNSASSTTLYTDSIIQRNWTFGDGTIGIGVDPTRIYTQPGTYTVCLRILSSSGCRDTICQTITIGSGHCEAVFTIDSTSRPAGGNAALQYFKFNSISSHGSPVSDSVIGRKWKFGDGDSLTGNVIIPIHGYTNAGTYNVCLYITTTSGCKDTLCKTIYVVAPANITCQAQFATTANGLLVNFDDNLSTIGINDSVINRIWTFGDNTSVNGNAASINHNYTLAGNYDVCLKIKTFLGCESVLCQQIQVTNTSCSALFSYYGLLNSNSVQFNSTISIITQGDSIISRNWKFGDSDSLNGNLATPIHNYSTPGLYPACLTIKTASSCISTKCTNIIVNFSPYSCTASYNYQILLPTSNGYPVQYDGNFSITSSSDSIIQHQWNFGDGTTSNSILPVHVYQHSGTYLVCHKIVCRSGCQNTICQTVIVGTGHCEAVFTTDSIARPAGGNAALHYFKFNSINSHGTPISDSIFSRKWKFGDGDSLTGNVIIPIHGYANTGTYNVCLYITTTSGCKDTICKTIYIVAPTNTNCQPRFETIANGLLVTFNANTSTTATGDSIISRSWTFGDGVTINNNTPVLTHQYPRAGIYQACLTIRTRLGCVSTVCKQIAVVTVSGNCVPYFTKEQIAATPKTIRFNSSAAYSQIPNDSIIGRKWEFGDGQILMGNVVNPLHTYLRGGTYTACLTIYTAHCDRRWCQTIQVLPLDSNNNSLDSVSIVSLYPVPVISPLNVVIHSAHANISAQLAIYDVYGVLKSTQTVILPLGNSNYIIPTAQLAAGPYIFKLSTVYGIRSRTFYKL